MITLALTGCQSGGGDAATATVTQTVVQGSDAAQAEAVGSEPPIADPTVEDTFAPTAADVTVPLKILSKRCFGSAGCNIEFRVQPTYSGDTIPEGKTVEVTYEIVGADDPYSNTFTLEPGDQASVQESEAVSTARKSTTLTAKVTSVSVL